MRTNGDILMQPAHYGQGAHIAPPVRSRAGPLVCRDCDRARPGASWARGCDHARFIARSVFDGVMQIVSNGASLARLSGLDDSAITTVLSELECVRDRDFRGEV